MDTSTGKVIDLFSISLSASFISKAHTTRGTRINLPTSLRLTYQLICDNNWYRNDCGTYCLAQDTLIPPAHYTCNTTTGLKICNEFYDNPEKNCSVSKTCISKCSYLSLWCNVIQLIKTLQYKLSYYYLFTRYWWVYITSLSEWWNMSRLFGLLWLHLPNRICGGPLWN